MGTARTLHHVIMFRALSQTFGLSFQDQIESMCNLCGVFPSVTQAMAYNQNSKINGFDFGFDV